MGGRGSAYSEYEGEWKDIVSPIPKDEMDKIYKGYVASMYQTSFNMAFRNSPDMTDSDAIIEKEFTGRQEEKYMDEAKELARLMDRVTTENTLPKNMKLTRYVGERSAPVYVGLSSEQLTDLVNNNSESEIRRVLSPSVGTTFSDKAFVSTAANSRFSFFDTKPIKVEISAKKGAKALVTDNSGESEVILPRGSNFRITGFSKGKGWMGSPQLVMRVELVED